MNSKDERQEHVLVSTLSQEKCDVSLVAKLDLDAEDGKLGLKFYVVKTHRRELFPKMKAELPRRKQSSGFTGDTGTLRCKLNPLDFRYLTLFAQLCIFLSGIRTRFYGFPPLYPLSYQVNVDW
jgi:hypothetical protein